MIFFFGIMIMILEEKNKTTEQIQENTNEQQEFRYRCKVCGNIFCYTQAEYDQNENQKNIALIGNLATGLQRGLGNSYQANESRKTTANLRNQIKDYSKCPHCNSSNIELITDENKVVSSSFEGANKNYASVLEQLAKLHDQGIITDDEFQQKKSEILAKM